MDEVLQDDSECKKKGIPVLVCPCCNADFYFTGDRKAIEWLSPLY
ncbi:hypothetical protein [Caproiciproducens sp. MSJ-32]|nr:hypothetical protein [Caproiciproducens sp. MSJ-32]